MLLAIDYGYNYLIKAKVVQPALTFLNLQKDDIGGGAGDDEKALGGAGGGGGGGGGAGGSGTATAAVSNPLRSAPL